MNPQYTISAELVGVQGLLAFNSEPSELDIAFFNGIIVAANGIQTVTSGAMVTPESGTERAVVISAQAEALTLANPTGTPVDEQKMTIRIKDDGTSQSITFGSMYRGFAFALPTSTVIGKAMRLGFMYNAIDAKWDLVAVVHEV